MSPPVAWLTADAPRWQESASPGSVPSSPN